MQRKILALVLAVMLLSVGVVSAEPTPAQSYWEQLKTIYEEWTAMDGETTMDITFSMPGEAPKTFHVHMTSASDMEDFVTRSVVHITSDDLDREIPTIEMYTEGANIYLNKEIVLFFAEMAGMTGSFTLEEDFVKLENSEVEFSFDSNFLMQVLEFIEGMDVDFEINMTLEDGAYVLSLTSDEMIDLFNAYMIHVMTNMNQLAAITGQSAAMELTEEEKAEALTFYQEMIGPMLEEARSAIAGSFFTSRTVFEENAFTETSELVFLSPFFSATITSESTANKLEATDIQLPTSVKVFTSDDLANMMMANMGGTGTGAGQVAFAVNQTAYTVDGQAKMMEVAPFIHEGRLMVPVRYLDDLFGMQPTWDAAEKTVTIVYNSAVYQMTIGSNLITVNGTQQIEMYGQAMIVDGRTFVPASRFARAMGIEYTWDGATQVVVFQ